MNDDKNSARNSTFTAMHPTNNHFFWGRTHENDDRTILPADTTLLSVIYIGRLNLICYYTHRRRKLYDRDAWNK